jgi:hypothetical protein
MSLISVSSETPKRDEVAGGRIKLHNEELHNLYSSSNTTRMIHSRRMTQAGYVVNMAEKRNADTISFEKPDGERSLRRLRRRWEDNIKMVLR